jgi:hypothetical protein
LTVLRPTQYSDFAVFRLNVTADLAVLWAFFGCNGEKLTITMEGFRRPETEN